MLATNDDLKNKERKKEGKEVYSTFYLLYLLVLYFCIILIRCISVSQDTYVLFCFEFCCCFYVHTI